MTPDTHTPEQPEGILNAAQALSSDYILHEAEELSMDLNDYPLCEVLLAVANQQIIKKSRIPRTLLAKAQSMEGDPIQKAEQLHREGAKPEAAIIATVVSK